VAWLGPFYAQGRLLQYNDLLDAWDIYEVKATSQSNKSWKKHLPDMTNGLDGFYYQKVTAPEVNVVQNLTNGLQTDVLTIHIKGLTDCAGQIELVNDGPYLSSIDGEGASNISTGETFGSYTPDNVPLLNVDTANAPTADFGFTQNDRTLSFTNLSTQAISSTLSFGDGANESIVTSLDHPYTSDGAYDICLAASSTCGSDNKCVNYVLLGTDNLDCTKNAIELNYPDIPSNHYKAIMSIESSGGILTGKDIQFTASDNINLLSGFEMTSGSLLTVVIGDCN